MVSYKRNIIKKILVLPALFFIFLQGNSQVNTSYLLQPIYWYSGKTDFGDGHSIETPLFKNLQKNIKLSKKS